MKWLESRILWGGLLILAGLFFLLQNIGLFRLGDLFWSLMMGLAGIFFLSLFIQNRANWWALIPGCTLLGVAVVIGLGVLWPAAEDVLGGSIVLGSIGVSFIIIYLLDRQNWWALIPAGVMGTLTIVAGLDNILPGMETGGVFFLGLGATFALLALVPTPQGSMRWAWIPAFVLLLMGFLLIVAVTNLINYIWPVALIIAGGLLVFRTFRRQDR